MQTETSTINMESNIGVSRSTKAFSAYAIKKEMRKNIDSELKQLKNSDMKKCIGSFNCENFMDNLFATTATKFISFGYPGEICEQAIKDIRNSYYISMSGM